MLVFLWSPGFDKWQRRPVNRVIHLLCARGVLAQSGDSVKGASRGPLPLFVGGVFSPREKGREIMELHRCGSQGYLQHSRGLTEGDLDSSSRQRALTWAPGDSSPWDLDSKLPPSTRTVKSSLRITSVDSKDLDDTDEQNT